MHEMGWDERRMSRIAFNLHSRLSVLVLKDNFEIISFVFVVNLGNFCYTE